MDTAAQLCTPTAPVSASMPRGLSAVLLGSGSYTLWRMGALCVVGASANALSPELALWGAVGPCSHHLREFLKTYA